MIRFISEQWIAVAKICNGVSVIDQTRMAKDALQKSIVDIQDSEETVKGELLVIARKVRQMDRETMKNATLSQLKRSRYLRQQLGLLSSKRTALEQHLDTLSSSELNQQVISSVRQTSTALKSMGLDVAQSQADGLLLDMEESMQDMQSIQKTLATPLMEDLDMDSSLLDSELDLLLMDCDDEIVSVAPSPINSMHSIGSSVPKKKRPSAVQSIEEEVEKNQAVFA